MPFSERDVLQRLSLLEAQVAALPGQQNTTNTLAQSSDVAIGATTALTDADVLTWVAADNKWENAPGGAGSDLWYVETGSTPDMLQPTVGGFGGIWLGDITASGNSGITGVDSHGYTHQTYMAVVPGIGAGGGDWQAETNVVGTNGKADFFFWARHSTGSQYEGGAFFDVFGDTGSGTLEAFFEAFADGTIATIENFVVGTSSGAEWDVEYLTTGGAANKGCLRGYADLVTFRGHSSNTAMAVAPDAAVPNGGLSFGWDGTSTLTFKGKTSGGTVKTTTLTLT